MKIMTTLCFGLLIFSILTSCSGKNTQVVDYDQLGNSQQSMREASSVEPKEIAEQKSTTMPSAEQNKLPQEPDKDFNPFAERQKEREEMMKKLEASQPPKPPNPKQARRNRTISDSLPELKIAVLQGPFKAHYLKCEMGYLKKELAFLGQKLSPRDILNEVEREFNIAAQFSRLNKFDETVSHICGAQAAADQIREYIDILEVHTKYLRGEGFSTDNIDRVK